MKTQSPRRFLLRLAMRRRVRALNFALGACLFAGSAVSALRAADGTWITDLNGSWSDSTNWLNGVIADGAGSTANFTLDITANRTITNDTPRTIGNLLFDDTGAANDSSWILTSTAANPLTFSTTTGTTSNINFQNTGGDLSISAFLAGTNNLVFNSVNPTGATTANVRNFNMQAANTYTGSTTLVQGNLRANASVISGVNSPLGNSTSAIILGNANTLANPAGGNPNLSLGIIGAFGGANNYTFSRNIDSSATADLAGRTRIQFYNDSATATGTMTVTGNWNLGAQTVHAYGLVAQQAGLVLDFQGVISGTGTATMRINDFGNGIGTVRLTNAANTFSNPVTVERGTLLVANNAATGAVPGALGQSVATTVGSNGVTPQGDVVSMLTDGAFTVGKTIQLGVNGTNAFTHALGGNQAVASSFTGNVNTTAASINRQLNLSQVAGGTTTLSGVIGANGTTTDAFVTNVEKVGAGTVVLSGNNTYDGNTRISAGTLLVNNVQAAGVGSGTSTGSVTVGVVSPAAIMQSGNFQNTGTGAVTVRQINGLSNTVVANLQIGQAVSGTGITAGSTVTGISIGTGAGTSSITLSTTFTVPASSTTSFTDLAFASATTATGTLGGSGTINMSTAGTLLTVNAGSTLAPGAAAGTPGILSIAATQTGTPTGVGAASLNLLAGSNLTIKLNGAAVGTGYDQVNVTGNVALGGGTLTLSINGLTATNGQKFVIINNDSTDTVFGTFAGQAEGSTINGGGGLQFVINYNAIGGADNVANDVVLTVTAVPEPGTWAMFAFGLGALSLIGVPPDARRVRQDV